MKKVSVVGPLGRWAVGPLGRWAVGPLGRWAVGPLGRWAVGPLGRWAVGLSVMCALGTLPVAHAQDEGEGGEEIPGAWVITKLEGTGSFTQQSKDTGGQFSGPSGESWTASVVTPGYDGNFGVGKNATASLFVPNGSGSNGSQAQVSVDGTFKVWLEWQGAGTPSKTCYLRVFPVATSVMGSQLRAGPNWSLEANNGVNSDSKNGSRPPLYSEDEVMASAAAPLPASGKIIKIDTEGERVINGRSIGLSLSANGNVSTTQSSSYWGLGYVSGQIYTGVEQADYSLSLFRVGAPPAKRKGDPGVVIDESKDEWIDEDGEGHGHSIYSYKTRHYTSGSVDGIPAPPTSYDTSNRNPQSFTASPGSAWSSSSTPQWSPSDETDYVAMDGCYVHSQEMPFGSLNFDGGYWKGTATGTQQKVIGFTLKDTTVTPTVSEDRDYNLTLHDPYEISHTIQLPSNATTVSIPTVHGQKPARMETP